MTIKFGWIKEPEDKRDYKYNPRLSTLLRYSDLREYDSLIDDQGSTNACVGCAVTSGIELLYKKLYNEEKQYSRLMVYYNARNFSFEGLSDTGCYIRDAIKYCNQIGFSEEILNPWSESSVSDIPSQIAYKNAATHKVTSYWKIADLDITSMLLCLSEGFPFIFGLLLYPSFFDSEETGYVPMPQVTNPAEDILGGHALLAVGFNNDYIICKNSWGVDFGDNGYLYIPYNYFIEKDKRGHVNPNYISDIWTIRL